MTDARAPYQPPTLTTLGSLSDLTLAFKRLGGRSDGDFLVGEGSLYTVSHDVVAN